jgi:GNAT superfamily N-acetyltransferase
MSSVEQQTITIEPFNGGQAAMDEIAEFDLAIKQGVQAAGQKDFLDIRSGWRELKQLDRAYAAPGAFWVARDTQADNLLVGCVGLKVLSGEGGLVGRLGVDERYRGYGIASRLMATLVDHAQDNGFTGLTLETGPKQHALTLYESLGFLIVGTASDGDHVMRLVL